LLKPYHTGEKAMAAILRRRNSMALLSLYDLESFVIPSVSAQTERLTISINDQRKIQVRSMR